MSADLIKAALKEILAEKQDHVAGSIAHQRMERAEAALRSVQLPLSQAMCALIESGQEEDDDAGWLAEHHARKAGMLPQPQEAIPADCDVRKIMLRVDPGEDGQGVEVYARNVGGVEALLRDLGGKVEEAHASQLALSAGTQDAGAQMHASRPESRSGSEDKAVLALPTGSVHADSELLAAFNSADTVIDGLHEVIKIAVASPAVAQPVADERENIILRRLLMQRVASLPYCDDGEMQDSSKWPHIDFKRDSAEDIEAKLVERARIALAIESQAGPMTQYRALVSPEEDAAIDRAALGQPADCSGDPQCCPLNEGHGCHCSPLATQDKPC